MWRFGWVIATVVAPCSLAAAESGNRALSTPESGYVVTLGATFSGSPRYEGASLYGPSISPTLDVRKANEPREFSSPFDGFDITVFGNRRFAVGPVFEFRGGRYRSSTAKLYGLRDIPWTIESGAFANFWPIEDKLRVRLEVRHGFRGRADGFVGDFSVDWVERHGRFTFAAGPRISAGDNGFMDANFGVLPSEALLNSALKVYDPHQGVKAAGIGTSLQYDWSDK